ncbi:MAG UNVERIFIED_CONTAM: hypothetical protein LVT10_05870 [Anaerolineae bacterium]|jgi:hypothetical protein
MPSPLVRRNAKYDREVTIAFSEILPEDLAMLRETMGFTDAMIDAAHTLSKWYAKQGNRTGLND